MFRLEGLCRLGLFFLVFRWWVSFRRSVVIFFLIIFVRRERFTFCLLVFILFSRFSNNFSCFFIGRCFWFFSRISRFFFVVRGGDGGKG